MLSEVVDPDIWKLFDEAIKGRHGAGLQEGIGSARKVLNEGLQGCDLWGSQGDQRGRGCLKGRAMIGKIIRH